MTCRGYDSKAVKLPKSIKRRAAQEINPAKRGDMIRSYVKILESELRTNKHSKSEK
jgi:hypothetical protein